MQDIYPELKANKDKILIILGNVHIFKAQSVKCQYSYQKLIYQRVTTSISCCLIFKNFCHTAQIYLPFSWFLFGMKWTFLALTHGEKVYQTSITIFLIFNETNNFQRRFSISVNHIIFYIVIGIL